MRKRLYKALEMARRQHISPLAEQNGTLLQLFEGLQGMSLCLVGLVTLLREDAVVSIREQALAQVGIQHETIEKGELQRFEIL